MSNKLMCYKAGRVWGKIKFPNKRSKEETIEDFPWKKNPVEEEIPSLKPWLELESIATSNPKGTIRKPSDFMDIVSYAASVVVDSTPTTYKNIVQNLVEDKWRIDINEKMHSLHQNHTWSLTNLLRGNKAIRWKWL